MPRVQVPVGFLRRDAGRLHGCPERRLDAAVVPTGRQRAQQGFQQPVVQDAYMERESCAARPLGLANLEPLGIKRSSTLRLSFRSAEQRKSRDRKATAIPLALELLLKLAGEVVLFQIHEAWRQGWEVG